MEPLATLRTPEFETHVFEGGLTVTIVTSEKQGVHDYADVEAAIEEMRSYAEQDPEAQLVVLDLTP